MLHIEEWVYTITTVDTAFIQSGKKNIEFEFGVLGEKIQNMYDRDISMYDHFMYLQSLSLAYFICKEIWVFVILQRMITNIQ